MLGDVPRVGSDRGRQARATEIPEVNLGAALVLPLEACELTRTRPQIGNLISLLLVGRPKEKLVWRATIPVGPNQGVSLFLPKQRRYSLENTSDNETIVYNTATYVSVDQDGDGQLMEWEA